jgi:hypothetical protein
LHGVLLVAQGMSMPQVGRLLGDAPRTVEYWVHHFEQKGPTGLTEGERRGRPARLSAAQIQEVSRVLRGKPSDGGMRVNLWDKPRPLIAKANPSQQKAYKKTPKTDARSAGRSLGPGRSPFSATRFSLPPAQGGILRRCAAERDGKFFYVRQAWRFNGQSFWEFLKLPREVSAVEGRTPNTTTGLETDRLCLHNRYFGLLDTVMDVVESQFRDWAQSTTLFVAYPKLLKTLCLAFNLNVFGPSQL